MKDKVCYCEAMDLIYKITGGYVTLSVDWSFNGYTEPKTWSDILTDVRFLCSNGWQIIAFHDVDVFGYIDGVISPDGSVAGFSVLYPRRAHPLANDGGLYDIDTEMGYEFDLFIDALEAAPPMAKP